ncbi:hypothetical protein KC364_g78 [Hortaea werneckii]|nr:hypothetical protein KC364_g78 [Hortaea werneckii]
MRSASRFELQNTIVRPGFELTRRECADGCSSIWRACFGKVAEYMSHLEPVLEGPPNQSEASQFSKLVSLDATHGQDMRLVHKSTQTARSGDQKIATLAELFKDNIHWETTVSDTRAQHGAIAHTTRLVENLDCQLTRRDNNHDQWLGLDFVQTRIVIGGGSVRLRRRELLGLAHQT